MSPNGSARRWRGNGCRVRLGVAALSALAVGVVLAAGAGPAAATASPCGQPSASNAICMTYGPAGGTTTALTLTLAGAAAPDKVASFEFWTRTAPTNVRPGGLCSPDGTMTNGDAGYGTFFLTKCVETIDPGATVRVCFDGGFAVQANPSVATFYIQIDLRVHVGTGTVVKRAALEGEGLMVPAVSGCSAIVGGVTTCHVPNVKGKALAAAEHAIASAHCALGKVQRIRSAHVRKGIVISQKPGAGSSGPKVSLAVSKGR